jgi:integrase/recombinase XerD
MIHVLRSFVVGPLEPYAAGFAADLERQGYTANAAVCQLGWIAHLSRWMADQRIDAVDLAPPMIDRYLAARHARGHRRPHSAKAFAPLLIHLRKAGVASSPAPMVLTPAEALLDRFQAYLFGERAMGAASVRGYVDHVRPFVELHVAGDGGQGLIAIEASDVTGFIRARAPGQAPKTTQRMASAMRALLRFWQVEGLTVKSLADAVPKVACRDPGLPKALKPAEVAALLTACDRGSGAGRRNFAMLLLMSRVGLRCGEVAQMSLGDIDWRRGEIMVVGKGGRRDRLPLPVDVGEAIVDYLRHDRPPDALDRCLFIRRRAPHRGLASVGVTQVVAEVALRAGLGVVHAHRLRHSAATSMLTAGAPLTEIGQVLRHRRPLTTAIYAKVDVEGLRALARPWPVGGAS